MNNSMIIFKILILAFIFTLQNTGTLGAGDDGAKKYTLEEILENGIENDKLKGNYENDKNVLIIVDVQTDFIDPSKERDPNKVYRKDFGSANDQGLSVFLDSGYTVNNHLQMNANQYGNAVKEYMTKTSDKWDAVVYSIDFHPKDHCSFMKDEFTGVFGTVQGASKLSDNENNNCFVTQDEAHNDGKQTLWTPHCVQGSNGFKVLKEVPRYIPNGGSDVNPELLTFGIEKTDEEKIDKEKPEMNAFYDTFDKAVGMLSNGNGITKIDDCFDHVGIEDESTIQLGKENAKVIYTLKGTNPLVDSYSAFEGNSANNPTGLKLALESNGFHKGNTIVTVLGVAYDVCVKWTALHASEYGYTVKFLSKLTAPVYPINQAMKDANEQYMLLNKGSMDPLLDGVRVTDQALKAVGVEIVEDIEDN